jgi:putative ABC transport system permease protein
VRFYALAFKNVWRRKTRSGLNCAGMAFTVCFIVSMLGTADGYERSFAQLYETRGVDLVIVRAGVTQRIASNLDESLGEQVRHLPGVREVEPALLDIVEFAEADLVAVYVFGVRVESPLFRERRFASGRSFRPGDHRKALLGSLLAKNLGKGVGDTVEIEGGRFEVVGVFSSDNVLESNGAVVPLAELQELIGRLGQVATFLVCLEDAPNKAELTERVRRQIDQLPDPSGRPRHLSVKTTRDHVKTNFEHQVLHGLAWASSMIAVIIGLISMLNTMTMSVFERVRELAMLRAVGWRKSRVVGLILLEAFLLSAVGAVIGVACAIPLLHLLSSISQTSSVVLGSVRVAVVADGVGFALVAGLLGATYPAYYAASLYPIEALRHE